MIRSFGDKGSERICHAQYVKRIDRTVQRTALRKLGLIHAAKAMEDLRIPPGIHVEQLAGDRHRRHNIGVNTQWRRCFVCVGGHEKLPMSGQINSH
ncbi:type II toxin-antitoxin system RelE/ParE family toxin [Paeniglutamicibacter gangotriensis]|uniref:Type II toxin-antitoxin system RelE/ParE family toxin n=1 Tax=Paeniglutamicibacter gangotriensis TaxID=254787 RepID=A0A5B0E5S9_9MICC|nr:type II toxin-antitoxin system RelE/ParE family toxin [Paeniglutamicibacter gangotriensis]KAA0974447.1 type II toxin-antitoxin system RelE/ParE family toxin [Paeniglutamicibacter gangotriensis]